MEDNGGPAKRLLELVVVFLLGVVLSSGVLYYLALKKPQKTCEVCPPPSQFKPAAEKPTPPDNLAVSQSLLTNPIIYEWRGSVEGKIIEKDEHTFTLQDAKGNSIKITDIMPTGQIFKTTINDVSKDGKAKQVSLKDIPLQTILRGDFWIFKTGKNVPVGGMFLIVK